jgi:hypothetical protein
MPSLKNCKFFILALPFLLLLVSKSALAETGVEAALKGTWKSVCMDLGSSVYIVSTATFDGAGASNDQVVFYKDSACTTPTGMVKANSKVSYSVGPRLGQQGELDLYPMDITIHASTLTQNGSVLQRGGEMAKQYDVFAVKGETLYLSALNRAKAGPITSPVDRPTQVDTKNIFTRQK